MNTIVLGSAAVVSGIGVGTWMVAFGVPNPLLFLVPATAALVLMVSAEIARYAPATEAPPRLVPSRS